MRAQGFPYHQQTFWPALPPGPQLHQDDEDGDHGLHEEDEPPRPQLKQDDDDGPDGHALLEDNEDAFL